MDTRWARPAIVVVKTRMVHILTELSFQIPTQQGSFSNLVSHKRKFCLLSTYPLINSRSGQTLSTSQTERIGDLTSLELKGMSGLWNS